MKLEQKALINTAGYSIYCAVLWLFTVMTTQSLGYTAVGILTLAMALGNSFSSVQSYGVRGFQSSDVKYQFSPAVYLRVRFITVIAGILLCFIFCILTGYSKETILSVLFFLIYKTSEVISDVYFGEFQREGRLELVGYSLALRGVISALLFFIGAFLLHTLNSALALIAIGGLVLTFALDYSMYRKVIKVHGSTSWNDVILLLQKCSALLLATIIPVLIVAIPRILLERYYGRELLGFYGNVSTPALLITTILPMYISSFFTRYGNLYTMNDFGGILRLWFKTAVGTIAVGFVCMLGVVLFGKPVMAFVYTESILPFLHYLYPVIAAMTLYTLTLCGNAVFVTVRNSAFLIKGVLIAFFLNAILAIPLVQKYGISGAIAALAIPYAAQAVVQLYWILKICQGKEKYP